MAVYPDFYNVKRGQIDSPEYAGEYKIPLIDKEDYGELLKASQKARQDKIAKSEDLFKELNNMKLQPKSVFSNPDMQAEAMNLQKQYQIDDANISAALNGGPYMIRKLESNYYNFANDAKYVDLLRQENAFQQFKKEVDKIKDPNFKKQAYASINAFYAGEPDPVTGKKMKAYDLNVGDYAPIDLEKDISSGLDALKVTTNVTEEREGMIQTFPKTSIDSKKAKDFINIYTANPAVQRNLAARGLGLVNGETGQFELNENGMLWIKNIVDSKSQETVGKGSTRFTTKTYNEMKTRPSTGMVTDDIAKGSILSEEQLRREGDQNVNRKINKFDEEIFRTNVNLKLKDPTFRKQMIDQGLMKEDGTFTEEYNKVIEVYKKKGTGEEIKQYKNAPKASSSSSSAQNKEAKGREVLKSAFIDKGLDLINVGGINLQKMVNYEVKKTQSGKYYLIVGGNTDNPIQLIEGTHYRKRSSGSGEGSAKTSAPASGTKKIKTAADIN